MTDGAGSAPAGWYDDPHRPGRLRYFDGELWTNHYHEPGKLPDLGNWISTTFGVFRQHWKGATIIAAGSVLVTNLVIWLTLRLVLNDLAVVDEELVNFDAADVVFVGIAVVISVLWAAFSNMALLRFLQRAHFNANPTIDDAARLALKRLPKFLAVHLALFLAAMVGVFVLALLFIVSPILGGLAILALIPAGVWLFVKLSFLGPVLAAAPASAPVLATSAGVSRDQFWGVFGRIVLVVIAGAIAGQMLSFATGGLGSPIDEQFANDLFTVEGDRFEFRDFRFADLFPSGAGLFWFIIISTVSGAVTTMISSSAYMRLYLDSGAPSEI